MQKSFEKVLIAGTLCLSTISISANAATQTFNSPTATTAETVSTYGIGTVNLVSATVTSGELLLNNTNGVNGSATLGSFAGDLSFEFDARQYGQAGHINVGFSAGNTLFYFHPGYSSNYFVPGITSGSMGFTPDMTLMTHIEADITSATKTFAISVKNGANSYSFSYVDPNYVPGTSQLGLTVGMVRGAGNGVFDNVAVTTAVPEPATFAMLLAGLSLIGSMVLRKGKGN